jgi:ribonuclease HII
MLPESVLKKAAAEMLDYEGSGQSVMEMSHRSKIYGTIIEGAEALLREVMNIPDNYKVLFLQGGASTQFAAIPMNLMTKSGKADYVITGQWAKKAFAEAYRNALAHCPGDYVCSDVFVDAVKELDIPAVQHSLIHGDALCYSIAAASIVAKVERDRYMIAAAEKFPQYGFEKNVGYGTKQHMDALREFGPCELHRRSFIKKILAERGEC